MKTRDSSLIKQHFHARIFKSYFDYIRDHYPDIDVNEICESAGLDYEYLQDENNWVSCVFNLNLMKQFAARIRDPEFSAKVGKYSVSKEGLGAALFNMGKNVFSIEYTYNNLWRISMYFTKVIRYEFVKSSRQFVSLRLTPFFVGLNEVELVALRELVPYIIQNTMGYYAALPRMKGLADSLVSVTEQGDSFLLEIKYPAEKFRSFEAAMVVAVSTVFSVIVDLLTESVPWSFSTFFMMIAIYTIYVIRRVIESQAATGSHLQENMVLVNQQYSRLQKTQEELDRKYVEAMALNVVSNHLVASDTEFNILNNICSDLCRVLSFDRALIFLRDEQERVLEFRAGHVGDARMAELLGQLKFEVNIPSDDPTKISNVYRKKAPILIKNVKEHMPTLNEESQRALAFSGSRSFVAVPIHSESDSFGVMLADNHVSLKKLTEEDMQVLSTVARQIALVLQKVRAQNNLSAAYDQIERLAVSYSRFVPFKLIDLIGFKSVMDVHLKAGREYEMAIVFSDIRGFTSMSENMPPMESVSFLNSYFSSLAPVFEEHGGIIDKFLGDGIMALFMKPEEALRASVEFQKKLTIYNQIHRSGVKRAFISAGIGIHFGKVLLGAVGYENRMSISVTSDSVNLASRIDGLNKKFGVDMLCSAEMVAKLKDRTEVRFIGRIQVQGRQSSTDIFEIIGHFDQVKIQRLKNAEPLIETICAFKEAGELTKAQELVLSFLEQYETDPVLLYYKREIATLIADEKALIAMVEAKTTKEAS